MQAAEWFAADVSSAEIARRLRVSRNAVYGWRRAWRTGGAAALTSKGPSGAGPRLSPKQLARLGEALEQGPAAHGFGEDQRWTLARVAELIARLCHQRYSLRGVSMLLHRMGYSPQMPAHRATQRNEQQVTEWRKEAWSRAKP